jgi:hypothetical protein
MAGMIALARLLCVPLLMALLTQIQLQLLGLCNPDLNLVARWVGQVQWLVLLTFLLVLPRLRQVAGKRQPGLLDWLMVWLLAQAPYGLLGMMARDLTGVAERLGFLACVAGSTLLVAGFGWWGFYGQHHFNRENAG